MFRPAAMHHVSLYVPLSEADNFIAALHPLGICQIKKAEEWEHEPSEISEKAGALYEEAKAVKELLESHRKSVRSIRRILFPKDRVKVSVEKRSVQAIVDDARKRLELLKPRLETNIDELAEQERMLSEELDNMQKFPPKLDLSLLRKGWGIAAVYGLVRTQNQDEIKKLPGVKVVYAPNKKTTFVALFEERENIHDALQQLHKIGFEELKASKLSGTAEDAFKELQSKLNEVRERLSAERKRLARLWEEKYDELDALLEELSIISDRYAASAAVGKGYSLAKMDAWVPNKNWKRFSSLAKKHFSSLYIVAEERDDAPTLLENRQPVKAFEQITKLYGLPKYGKLDPTPVLAISFALFFGFMLTDAVYGIVLSLIGALLVVGIGRHDEAAKGFGIIMIVSGMFTSLLGALFGSWLGSLLTGMFHIPFWIDPMKEATIVLIISLAIGIAHMVTGYILGVIDAAHAHDLLSALRPGGVMLTFIGGILVFIASMFAGSWLQPVALGMIGLSVIGNFIFAYKQDGSVMSALSIFDYTGFLGDWFSYARLMSLALGTAGIALAVNFMAGMVGKMIPVVGSAAALLLIIGGHGFNMGINSLGAFVHSLRLHFLEFFSKFYEGGGIEYVPFYAQRKITEVK